VSLISPTDCVHLLIRELSTRYHRSLTNNQLHLVTQRCFHRQAPPLYVLLVAGLVHTWSSSQSDLEDLVSRLPLTTDEAIDAIVERVESRFGQQLVARVLGFLCASEFGLSDGEMDDVLSLDDVALSVIPSPRELSSSSSSSFRSDCTCLSFICLCLLRSQSFTPTTFSILGLIQWLLFSSGARTWIIENN
jgi:hypothetical protein